MRNALKLESFTSLAGSALLNELAFVIAETALALLVYHRTRSALGATAFFLCVQFAPAFVSLVLVTRLDQWSASRGLIVLYGLEALIFLILGQLATRLVIAYVLLLALLQASLAIGAKVLARAAWVLVAKAAGALRDAGAIVNSAASVCYLVGPALGGVLVAFGGTRLPLYVNAGLLVLCIGLVATARNIPPSVPDPGPLRGRLASAVKYVQSDSVVRRILSLQAAFMVFFTIAIPVEVVFARQTLHAGASGYGLLVSAWGGGAIAGSLVYARWRARSFRALIASGAGSVGVGLAAMATAPDLAVAIVGAAVAGIGNGIEIVAMRTALQEAAPAQWMSSILGLNESMFQGVPGIGIVLGGALMGLANPRLALAVGALGSAAVGLAMWLAFPAVGAEAGASRPLTAVTESEVPAIPRGDSQLY